MYFVAGANIIQMGAVGGLAGVVSVIVIESRPYAQQRNRRLSGRL